MTKQEAFDRVARHLLQQAARSEGGSGCLYRCPDGRKCAIGCLIADKDYRQEMENNSVSSPVLARWREKAGVEQYSHVGGLLRTLQDLHDDVPIGNWPNQLRQVAEDFQLDPLAARIEQDEWEQRLKDRKKFFNQGA